MNIDRLNKLLLKTGVSNANTTKFAPILNKYFDQEKFNEENIARFLANAYNETGLFTKLRENLYYTTPDRLRQVFPSVFATGKYRAEDYIKNEEKLGNLVYDSRLFPLKKSLGNTRDLDGAKYRGAGLFQTTGRYGFQVLTNITHIDFISHPELLQDPEYAVRSAIEFWKFHDLSKKPNLTEVRRIIGGSLFGLKEVNEYYVKIKIALTQIQ